MTDVSAARTPHSSLFALATATREQKRDELRQRLLAHAEGRDPFQFLDFIRQQRRGYDAKHDGPSELMQLVDDIHEFAKDEEGFEL